jgi:DNA topoisomerase-1
MSNAQLERTSVKIGAGNLTEVFQAKGEVIKFDGFLKVYMAASLEEDDEDQSSEILPSVEIGDHLDYQSIKGSQRFSRPAPRYVEASLVKKLEELGIGRPSTYAPTISTIQKRGYVEKKEREGDTRWYSVFELVGKEINEEKKSEVIGKEKNKLFPTDIGIVVTDFLSSHFEQIMDYHFTADVEQQFDDIAQGKIDWTLMLHKFYDPFHSTVENTLEHSERATGERDLGVHPESGKKVIVRIGRFGPMVQIGDEKLDGEKPAFASLRADQSIGSMTLEMALELFKLPRTLGEYEELTVKANVGRFGPYIQHGKSFVSIKKEDDPMTVSLERAIEIILQKREDDANKILKVFSEDDTMQILQGRWGAYLKIGKDNYKLPKDSDIEKLSYADCVEIKNNQPEPKKGGRFAKKTTSKK